MASSDERLSGLANIQSNDLSLSRDLLKDRAAKTLRDYISSGRVPEGTKLTEREVSALLGISRAPARDALMALETEGLVVTRPNGRYVIELTETDVQDIYTVRWTLEKLAAELAAADVTSTGKAQLLDALQQLEEAAVSSNAPDWIQADMHLHRTIWRLANNAYLLKVLDSVFGAIFVLADRFMMHGARDYDRGIAQHRELVEPIIAGDSAKAGQAMEQHFRLSLKGGLKTYRAPKET